LLLLAIFSVKWVVFKMQKYSREEMLKLYNRQFQLTSKDIENIPDDMFTSNPKPPLSLFFMPRNSSSCKPLGFKKENFHDREDPDSRLAISQ
jgi:hypothetical protein